MKNNAVLKSALSAWLLGVSSTQAYAVCNEEGMTATCDGNNVNAFSSANPNQTLNILANASITPIDIYAVSLTGSGNLVINNAGYLTVGSNDSRIVSIAGNNTESFTLNNHKTIQAFPLSQNVTALEIDNVSYVAINNDHIISGTGKGLAIADSHTIVIDNADLIHGYYSAISIKDTNDQDLGDSVLIINDLLGEISSSNESIVTIDIRGIDHTTLANRGLITNLSPTAKTPTIYVENFNDSNDTFTLLNTGAILSVGDISAGITTWDIDYVVIDNKGIIQSSTAAISIKNTIGTNFFNGEYLYAEKNVTFEAYDDLGMNDDYIIFENHGIIDAGKIAVNINNIHSIDLSNFDFLIAKESALVLESNNTTTITNSGLIHSTTGYGILAYDLKNQADFFNVANTGKIQSLSGISLTDIAYLDLNNSGEITASSFGFGLVQFNLADIKNSGTITSTGDGSIAIFATDPANSIKGDVLHIANTGLIDALAKNAKGVYASKVNLVIVENSGTIAADVFAFDLTNVPVISIENSGHIESNSITIYAHDNVAHYPNQLFILNLEAGEIIAKENGTIFANDVKDVAIQNLGLISGHNDAFNMLTSIISVSDAINVDDDTFLLLNDGVITGSGNYISGIGVSHIKDVDIENTNLIEASLNAIEINDAKSFALLNSGNINSIQAMGVSVDAVNAVDINNSGSIIGFNLGIFIQNALSTDIKNSGIIQSTDLIAMYAFDNDPNNSDRFSLKNSGFISSASGVSVNQVADVSIQNSKQIQADKLAIRIDDASAISITNTANGVIHSDSYSAIFAGDFAGNGLIEDDLTILNAGLISGFEKAIETADINTINLYNRGSILSQNAEAIRFVDAKSTVIDNFGSIQAVNSATAILSEGNSQDTLNHYGSIKGDVLLNAGNDTVSLFSGMSIDRTIDAGDDVDQLFLVNHNNVEGTFNLNQAVGFEHAEMTSGTWTLSGTGVTHFDTFDVKSGTLKIGGEDNYNNLIIQADAYNQAAPSTLIIGLSIEKSGQNDRITIQNGTAYLAGHVVLNYGDPFTIKTGGVHEYTIFSADLGVNGQFDSVSPEFQNSLVLNQSISYQPNDVVVRFGRTAYEDVGLKFENDIAFAAYNSAVLDNGLYSGDIEAYLRNLDSITSVTAMENALRKNNGETYDIFSRMLLTASENTLGTIATHLQAQPTQCKTHAATAYVCDDTTTIWVKGSYSQTNLNSFDEHNRYQLDAKSVIGGADIKVTDHLKVGLAVNYHQLAGSVDLRNDQRVAETDGEVMGITVYFRHQGLIIDNSYVLGAAGYQRTNDLNMDRLMNIAATEREPGITRQFRGTTDAEVYNAMFELGWDVTTGSVAINPYARVMVTHVNVENFTEESRGTASNLALNIASKATTMVTPELGVNLKTSIDVSAVTLQPYLNINGQYHSNTERELDVSYSAIDGNSARIHSNDGGAATFGAGGGLDLQIGKHVTFGVSGNFSAGDQYNDWNADAHLKITF